MKFLIYLSFIIMTVSCSKENVQKYECTRGTIRILNKEIIHIPMGSVNYYIYLYDGKKVYSCNTNAKTYDYYNINDTVPALVITKTIEMK